MIGGFGGRRAALVRGISGLISGSAIFLVALVSVFVLGAFLEDAPVVDEIVKGDRGLKRELAAIQLLVEDLDALRAPG